MGLFGFYFLLKCIKLLAWPTFAQVYPLCASVQAIEKNSNCQMRKLVTYWILSSLISLLEHTFSGFIQWLPVWHYVKIIAIFWLIIPCFDGASIAYNCFVRPCISMQLPQIVLSLLNKNQNLSCEEESFPVGAQNIDEHGAEDSEDLISTKPKVIKPTSDHDHDHIKTVETLNGSAAAADKTTTKQNACVDVKILTLPLPLKEDVQREWTCAMCQVTTTSEATLKSHLQGRKHRTKCEELKAGKQTTKKGVNIGGPNKERYCTICQVKTQSEASWNSHVQGKKHKSNCKELRIILEASKNINFSSSATKSNQANNNTKKSSSDGGPSFTFRCANTDPKKTSSDGGLNNRFVCDICQMTLQSEATLKSHLQGRKH